MSLEELYNSAKKPKQEKYGIAGTIGTLLFLAFILFITNSLWNYVAPAWALPKLSFLQFSATIILINMLRALAFGTVSINR